MKVIIDLNGIISKKFDFRSKNRTISSIIETNHDYCMNIFHWGMSSLDGKFIGLSIEINE